MFKTKSRLNPSFSTTICAWFPWLSKRRFKHLVKILLNIRPSFINGWKRIRKFFIITLRTCSKLVELGKLHVHLVKLSMSHSNFLATKILDMCDNFMNEWMQIFFTNFLISNCSGIQIRIWLATGQISSSLTLFFSSLLSLKPPFFSHISLSLYNLSDNFQPRLTSELPIFLALIQVTIQVTTCVFRMVSRFIWIQA